MNRKPLHHSSQCNPKNFTIYIPEGPGAALLRFYCGGSPLIIIGCKLAVCVILETNLLCSVSSSYTPIITYMIPLRGVSRLKMILALIVLILDFNHAQDTK